MSYYDDLSSPGSPMATVNGFGNVDYTEMNKGLQPVFMTQLVKNDAKSELENRPVFDEHEIVMIHVAGDQLNVATHPVDDRIKERFAVQYERYKAGKVERHIDGTPLRDWPPIDRRMAAECEASGIFSVEHLAALSDSNIHKVQDGRIWRAKADAFLKMSKDGAAIGKYAAENERMKTDMSDLKRQITELSAQITSEGKRKSN